MNYFKRALTHTLHSIRKRKGLFILLLALQVIFVISIIAVAIYFQLKIFEEAKGIMEPLQNANYDANSIEEGTPFTEEMLSIYQSYASLKHNVMVLLAWLLALFLCLNSGIWILSHSLLGNLDWKKWKDVGKMWVKNAVSTLVLGGSFFIISYFLLLNTIRAEDTELFARTATILQYSLVVIYYFLLAALAVSHQHSWKGFVRKIYDISIKNLRKTLPVLLLVISVLLAAGYLVYYSVNNDQAFIVLALTSFFFIVSVVMTRLFWIEALNEL